MAIDNPAHLGTDNGAAMAEQITLAYRLFTMRRWAGASWATAAAWACGLVWRNARNDRRAKVKRTARQRI